MTIIIPAYNCSKTLGRTLDSLVQQTNKEFSVVIIDDCSTENILDIIKSYEKQLKIKYIRNTENQGCGAVRQIGIDEVGLSDNYIAFLDSDDILFPWAIDTWNQASLSEYDIIFTPFFRKGIGEDPKPFDMRPTLCGPYMTHGKVYSTKFIKEKGIYSDKRIRYYSNDYFLNHLALNCTENIGLINVPTYMYIKTQGSTTMSRTIGKQYSGPMRRFAFEGLRNFFKENNISAKEDVYRQNANKMFRFCMKNKNIIESYIDKINNIKL